MSKTVEVEIHHQAAVISFNRPDNMNAFNQAMSDDLLVAIDEVAKNKEIRAVLLKGNGPCFLAGGDITFFKENLASMPRGVPTIIAKVNQVITMMQAMDKPILALVHGAVAGVGMSFMMACDLVIADENTQFTMAYSSLGTSPDGGASYFLPRLVGNKKALELLLLSERFDAPTIKQLGIINWIKPSAECMDFAEKTLQTLANGPTTAYSRIKKLVNNTWDNDLLKQLKLEQEAFTHCVTTVDFAEGVTAFLAKEKPGFIGE